jgi:geranylgeranyl pyrophosphate synthase
MVDDIRDYVASSAELGKPGAGADLGSGLRTGPLLLAARSLIMKTILMTSACHRNDAWLAELLATGMESCAPREEVVGRVVAAGGVAAAMRLAREHGAAAIGALSGWEGEQVELLKGVVAEVLRQPEAAQ